MTRKTVTDSETDRKYIIDTNRDINDDIINKVMEQYLTTGDAPKGFLIKPATPTITRNNKEYQAIIPKKYQPFQPIFPVMDEIVGGVRGALNKDLSIGDAIKLEKDTYNQAYEDNFAGSLGKEILSSGGLVGIGRKTFPKLIEPFVPSTQALTKKNVSQGAGYGLFSGDVAVDNEQPFGIDLEQTLINKGISGVGGAVLNPVTQFGTNAILNVVKYPFKAIATGASDKLSKINARKIITNALAEGDSTPKEVVEKIIKTADPNFTIADVNGIPSLRELLAAATIKGGTKSRNDALKFLNERNDGSIGRIDDELKAIFGDKAGFFQSMESLKASRSETADRLYTLAFKRGKKIPVDAELESLMNTKFFKQAYEKAKEIADARKIPIKNFSIKNGVLVDEKTGNIVKNIDTEFLHFIKLGMDDNLSFGGNKDGGIGTTLNRDLLQLKNEFVNWLDGKNGLYKRARSKFAGDTAVADAMELGNNVFKQNPEELKSIIKFYNPSELEAFRLGFISSIQERLDKTIGGVDGGKGANAAWNLIKTGRNRELLELSFGDNKKGFQRFFNKLKNENAFKDTSNRVSAKSNTATDRAMTETIEGVNEILKPKNITTLLKDLFVGGEPVFDMRNQKVSQEITRILTTSGKKELLQIQKELEMGTPIGQVREKYLPALVNLIQSQAGMAGVRAFENEPNIKREQPIRGLLQ